MEGRARLSLFQRAESENCSGSGVRLNGALCFEFYTSGVCPLVSSVFVCDVSSHITVFSDLEVARKSHLPKNVQ